MPGATTNTTVLQPSGARLFVGVISASANRAKRDAVRSTWGSHPALARVMFVISRPQTVQMLDAIREEALQHRDIIVVGHVAEAYHNITYQSLEVFRAAYVFNGSLTHVMKCDDDTYVHVDRLLLFLAKHPFFYSWAGRISTSYSPIRDPSSKWHVDKLEWPEDQSNIKWSNGPGYVLTMDLVRLLATGGVIKCYPGQLFKLEDVAVGSWLSCLEKEQNITIHTANDGNFNIESCAPNDLSSHYMSPSAMLCMHARDGNCCV